MTIDSRFEKFILSLPSIEGIDHLPLNDEDRKNKKADYLGMGRKIIFEQKCINKDQSDKIQSEVEKYIDNENYPLCYGKRDINLVLEKLPNKKEINRRIISKTTKLLESYMREANKQIASTKKTFKIFESTGVLIILNDKVKFLSPEIVAYTLQNRLRERKNGESRLNNIDYIIFISETHEYKGIPCIIILEGEKAKYKPLEISEYIEYTIRSWAQFNGGETLEIHNKEEFIANISEKKDESKQSLTRAEARSIWYKNNRYMKNWSNDEVAKATAQHIDTIQPFVLKGGPKLKDSELGELMLKFGDFIDESNLRGLDLKELKKYHEI